MKVGPFRQIGGDRLLLAVTPNRPGLHIRWARQRFGKQSGDNFGVFGTWSFDGAYLAGMLAGKMTKSNVVGSVGAMPIPEVNMLINAFALGVKAVNPNAKSLCAFIGAFFDPPKAREAGLAQIDAGADILFGERIGTADAAKERKIRSIRSAQSDRSSIIRRAIPTPCSQMRSGTSGRSPTRRSRTPSPANQQAANTPPTA